MPRPARWFSRQGLLLVEAGLAAVVIAVGLTFITRSLSSQLNALRTVEDYATLTQLAQATLLEMERDVQAGRPPSRAREGTFNEPNEGYEWTLSAAELTEPHPATPCRVVRLTVRRADRPASTVVLRAVWPSHLVPEEWR